MSEIVEPTVLIEETRQFVTLRLHGQLIGLPIHQVRDVFQITDITPVPLADKAVLGLVNLRGRIVLVFSLAGMLGMERRAPGKVRMAISVDWRGETFGIHIDDIGDVLEVPVADSAILPAQLDDVWARHARKVHKLDRELMIELDLNSLLETPLVQAA